MRPTIPCTDPRFKYTPAHQTDVRKTWSDARRAAQLKAEQERVRRSAEAVFPGHCAEAVR